MTNSCTSPPEAIAFRLTHYSMKQQLAAQFCPLNRVVFVCSPIPTTYGRLYVCHSANLENSRHHAVDASWWDQLVNGSRAVCSVEAILTEPARSPDTNLLQNRYYSNKGDHSRTFHGPRTDSIKEKDKDMDCHKRRPKRFQTRLNHRGILDKNIQRKGRTNNYSFESYPTTM